nr:MAG TPA: hypothetical protein [Caudoviricetes sp.]
MQPRRYFCGVNARKRCADEQVCITAWVQVRSGDKSVKSLSVKRPQADFFLVAVSKVVEKVHKM